MDYISRFGLESNPFTKNAKEILIETEDYKELVYRLNYLLNNKGFGLITGESGRGKTTIIRNWSKSLSESLYKVIYISLSTVTVNEFYSQLAQQLKIERVYKKVENFNLIQQSIIRLSLEKKITPVFVFDEANYMCSGIMNDLKMIFNFEMDSKDRAVVLLVGSPLLINTLKLNSHESLRQRITMNYHLNAFSKSNAKQYIQEKLKKAGSSQDIFEESAIESITNAANGTPRIINKICDQCLFIANSKNLSLINNDIAMAAYSEAEIS